MLDYQAAKKIATKKGKKADAPAGAVTRPREEEVEVDEVIPPLKRKCSEVPRGVDTAPMTTVELLSPVITLQRSTPAISPWPTMEAGSSRSHERCPDLQRSNLEGLMGHRPEIFLNFLQAPSPSRESTAALSLPLETQPTPYSKRERNGAGLRGRDASGRGHICCSDPYYT